MPLVVKACCALLRHRVEQTMNHFGLAPQQLAQQLGHKAGHLQSNADIQKSLKTEISTPTILHFDWISGLNPLISQSKQLNS